MKTFNSNDFFDVEIKKDFKKIKKIFKKYLKNHLKSIIIGLIAVTFHYLASLGMPYISKYIVDNIIRTGNFENLGFIIIIGVCIVVLKLFTNLVSNYYFFKATGVTEVKFKNNFFEKIQFAEPKFFSDISPGEITYRISQDVNKVIHFSIQVLSLLPGLLVTIITFILIFSYHTGMSFLILLLIFIQTIVVIGFKKKILKYAFLVKEKSQEITKYLVNHFSIIELIRTHAAEKVEQLKFHKLLRNKFTLSFKRFMLNKLSSAITQSSNHLWTYFILGYGALQIAQLNLTIGDLMGFLLLTNILAGPIKSISILILQYQDIRASLYRIIEYEENDSVNTRKLKYNSNYFPGEIKKEIKLENVSFSYNNNDNIFKNVNAKFASNSITVVVGPNGGGKTTLGKLLVGIYRPNNGKIILNKYNINKLNLKKLRKNVHLSLQTKNTFEGTFWDNLTYGVKKTNKKEVLKVIKKSSLNTLYYSLPKGFDTYLGQDGFNISKGQAQKISFARSLLISPKILILDEIFSSLDKFSESKIKEELIKLKKEKNIIIIAHRPSVLDIGDQILMVKNKNIESINKVDAKKQMKNGF